MGIKVQLSTALDSADLATLDSSEICSHNYTVDSGDFLELHLDTTETVLVKDQEIDVDEAGNAHFTDVAGVNWTLSLMTLTPWQGESN